MTSTPVTLFTDPACPFAFSAEPVRWRLLWHYDLDVTTRMIVLTREEGEAGNLVQGAPALQKRHGMPIDPRPYEREASSEPACRAFVAVRERDSVAAERLLRALRVRVMQHGLLDDPELIAAAAADAGVEDWSGGEDALEADAAAARDPLPAAHRLDHKLGGPAGQRRYTAPSWVIRAPTAFGGASPTGADWVVPGFNPIEAYETVLGNLGAERRPKPESVTELLEWAGEPLATAEVVMVMAASEPKLRAELARVARFTPAGADGYWTLA